jgi:hypothetical protein
MTSTSADYGGIIVLCICVLCTAGVQSLYAKNPNPSLQLVVLQMHAAGNMLRYPAACILSAKS